MTVGVMTKHLVAPPGVTSKGNQMNIAMKRSLRVAAMAAAAALTVGGLSACAPSKPEDKTFTVWWYEKDTAMAKTWAAALEEFKTAHPDVTVKFELKTWDQLQKSGNAILDSDAAPDLSEWNKGNATAGTASAAGLLVDLNKYADQYGWNKELPQSVLAYGEYTDGIMGSGNLYGVPTYGEYVSWFYNKDMFKAAGVAVPTTPAELDAALQKFKDAGQTQCLGGAGYQNVHLAYALALSQADQQFVKDFQLFANPVNWDKQWGYAANKIVDWKNKGYLDPNVSGITPDDSVAAFEAGKCPLMLGGTWLDQGMADKATSFEWGKFLNPGGLSEGSAGNLLVIPSKGKHADWAAEFINMTLSTKYQNMLGNEGGLPFLAEASALTNPVTVKTYAEFDKIVKNDALGMYPDWPVPGYFDVQLAAGTKLLSDGDAAAYLKTVKDFYEANKVTK
jgi:raffinose/stachyose/melibiose transport system substrate-binding protein